MGRSLSISRVFVTTAMILWVGGLTAALPPNHAELTSSKLNGEFKHLKSLWKAVGLVQYEIANKRYSLQTGFFYKPNMFMMYRSPDTSKPSLDCDKIFITTGFIDAKKHDIKKEYRCIDEVGEIPEYGIKVIRVEKMDGSPANHTYIPLGKVRMRVPKRSRDQYELQALGFTVDRKAFVSKNCRVTETDFQLSDSVQRKKPNLKFAKYGWTRLNCVTQSGMQGGPILKKKGSKWVAVGLTTAITRRDHTKKGFFDSLVFPQFYNVLSRHNL